MMRVGILSTTLLNILVFITSSQKAHASQELRCSPYSQGDCDVDNDSQPKWSGYTIGDFWESLGCDEIFEEPRPIHNQSTWMLFRGIYHGIVGISKSTIGPITHTNGIHVPYSVKQIPGKGRGLFAAEDIEKGSRVWSSRQTACFWDGDSYRKFLALLPADLACDVMNWAYIVDRSQGFGGGGEYSSSRAYLLKKNLAICVDLDEGILINSGTYSIEDMDEYEIRYMNMGYYAGEVTNIGCDSEKAKEVKGGCKDNMFALRNIRRNEEILVSYDSFAELEWDYFGLE